MRAGWLAGGDLPDIGKPAFAPAAAWSAANRHRREVVRGFGRWAAVGAIQENADGGLAAGAGRSESPMLSGLA